MIDPTIPPFYVFIPARLSSSRLPNKVLCDLNGRPMIAHTIERAQESGAAAVLVATENPEVAKVAKIMGAEVILTPSDFNSGTDRIAWAVDAYGLHPNSVIVNLQADEPMFPGEHLASLAALLNCSAAEMATIAVSDLTGAQLADPNVVKVVGDKSANALYFSRAGVPFSRDGQLIDDDTMRPYFMRHVGVYAYRAGFLRNFMKWGVSPLEYTEKLEQLRVLWNGGFIQLLRLNELTAHGVDTQDDLDLVRSLMLKTVVN